MPHSISNFLLVDLRVVGAFLLWEAAMILPSLRVVAAMERAWGKADPEERLIFILGLSVIFSGLAATLLTFLSWNSGSSYALLAAALIGAMLAKPRSLRADILESWNSLMQTELLRRPAWACVIAGLFYPLLFLSFRPVDEIDSLNYLSHLLEWMANRSTPYVFSSNNVVLWEAGFLPSWILSRSDVVFSLVSLHAIALAALSYILAGREFGLSGKSLIVGVASVMALRHYWWPHSGVGTLKNDAIVAAGVALITVSLLRALERFGPFDVCLFTLGAVFITSKFSGVAWFAASSCIVLFLRRGDLTASPRESSLAILLSAGTFTLTTGHYYLKNMLVFGNPLWPYSIHLGPISLSGLGEQSGTSILYSIGDARLWKILFLPEHGISAAGLLFPLILAASLICFSWMAARGLMDGVKREKGGPKLAAAILLFGWWVYFRGYWSASAFPGDLRFLASQLSSIRLVEGTLALSELLLLSLLLRSRAPRPLVWGMLMLDGGSRLCLLYADIPAQLQTPAVLTTAIIVIVLIASLRIGPPVKRASFTALATSLPVLLGASWIVEANRAHWLPDWSRLLDTVRRMPPSSFFLIEAPRAGYRGLHYPLAGGSLRNAVRTGDESALEDLIDNREPPRYVVRPFDSSDPDVDGLLSDLTARLSVDSFYPAMFGDNFRIFERMQTSDEVLAESRAVYIPQGELAYAGAVVDGGGVGPSQLVVESGTVAFSPLNPHLRRIKSDAVQRLHAPEETRLTLINSGSLDEMGQPKGLDIYVEAGRWFADEPPPSIPKDAGISSDGEAALTTNPGEPPIYRLEAHAPGRWMILSAALPANLRPGTPITLRAELRCPANACQLTLLGDEPLRRSTPQSDQWKSLRLSAPYRPEAGWWGAGVGAETVNPGDRVEVRDLHIQIGDYPELNER